MTLIKKLAVATAFMTAMAAPAFAQYSGPPIKLGVLSDMSGLYADLSGPGSVIAAKLAIEDFGAAAKGMKVDVIGGDHQNKADVGASIARQWYDQDGVDVILDVPNSAVALAVSDITKEKNKIFLNSGAATSDLTGPKCTPNTIHWAYDTWMLANGTGKALVKQGGDSWFFLTADYAFGYALERDTMEVVKKEGGKVVGNVRVPLNNQDFSSFLLQAQASKAKVIGLANAGGDTTNSIKGAAEFGITQAGQKLAGLLVDVNDVHGLGLQVAQGLTFTDAWYWDLNDDTRKFAARFSALNGGKYPGKIHAGVYSSVIHYLKAVEAVKSKADGAAVVKKMKELPTDDTVFGKGEVRQDGRKTHPVYLVEVKKPSESKKPWDYYKILTTIPANEAFRPLKEGNCPLVN